MRRKVTYDLTFTLKHRRLLKGDLHTPTLASDGVLTVEEALARFRSARERGALITVTHPFEPGCEFVLDLQALPFDCLEVWNGPMREANLKAIGLWQSWLAAGQKVPICGGSDYHRDTPFIFLGGPTTCVIAESASPADILRALKAGHAYLTFAPNGPWLELTAGDAIMGDTVAWPAVDEMELEAGGLLAGYVVRVVTRAGNDVVAEAPADGKVRATVPVAAPGFARVGMLRVFIPGVPRLPAVPTNPIHFDAVEPPLGSARGHGAQGSVPRPGPAPESKALRHNGADNVVVRRQQQ